MKIFVHALIVRVATTDANLASVAASADAALSSLTRERHGWYAHDAQAVEGSTRIATIPDPPFGDQPDNDAEMRADDDWMNGYVIGLTGEDGLRLPPASSAEIAAALEERRRR